jgi:hypothetical protein
MMEARSRNFALRLRAFAVVGPSPQDGQGRPGAPFLQQPSMYGCDAALGCDVEGVAGEGAGRHEQGHLGVVQDLGRPEELLEFGAGDGEVGREPLALDDDAPPVGCERGDVDAPVPSATLDDDVGAAVAAQQSGDVFFELAPE